MESTIGRLSAPELSTYEHRRRLSYPHLLGWQQRITQKLLEEDLPVAVIDFDTENTLTVTHTQLRLNKNVTRVIATLEDLQRQ